MNFLSLQERVTATEGQRGSTATATTASASMGLERRATRADAAINKSLGFCEDFSIFCQVLYNKS